MKSELPATLTRQIALSQELLNRSKILMSELGETLEYSRKLLDESLKIIASLKPEKIFKGDRER
jgi:hypothetical protein